MKILIFTDSRGQHKPKGSTHEMFPYRIAKEPGFEVELYLCPFKWTTTLDFLATFTRERLLCYDAIILYTGIVDWSPRPEGSARNDLYDSQAVANEENLLLNTDNYGQKILNNKKVIFDQVFGEASVNRHLSEPFEQNYEGSRTVNMYSLEMAEASLIPRLVALPNLLFINSNRFCTDWNGDYWKARPSNIRLTEAYSELFARSLPRNQVIDLLEWQESDVRRFTCDNLHLSESGNDYIYEQIMQRLKNWPARRGIVRAGEHSAPSLQAPRLTYDELVSTITHQDLDRCRRTTLIIGARTKEGDEERIRNLAFLLRWLEKFYGGIFDVLIVEQDDKPRLQQMMGGLPNGMRLEFIYNPDDFNRGWGYNTAVAHFCGGSDVVALMDTDVLTGDGFVDCVLACHHQYQAVSPNQNVYYTNADEAAEVLRQFSYSSLRRPDAIKNPVTITGGIVIVRKSAFLAVNGFEQYIGYGCEDRAMDVTLINRYGSDALLIASEVYVHLHHEPDKAARANFDGIYGHLTGWYGCKYDTRVGPHEYIHKNCDHAPAPITEVLANSRRMAFADPDLYRPGDRKLTSNGQPMAIQRQTDNGAFLPILHAEMRKKNFEGAIAICNSALDSHKETQLNGLFLKKREEIKRTILELADLPVRASDTLVILGNGPSLKDVMDNPAYREILKRCDTFGLNAAYRAYVRFDFYPTYFGSFDYEVCESHKAAYEDLVLNCGKIKKYYFAKNKLFAENVREHPRFQKINFIPAPMGVSRQLHMSTSFDEFNDIGSSGTNAVQVGYVLGYRKFILLGCDCKYVEILDGIEVKNEVRYRLTKDLEKNPNYWFDDYQKAGDKFNKPNTDSIQYVAWQKLRELQHTDNFTVSNGSYPSALRLFDKVPFGIYTQEYENIFLVMSCRGNSERINAVRRQYENSLSRNDLVLFVVGGADHDGISDESMLSLSCGDLYENLPKKVYRAIRFCVQNLRFRRIVKVDDDIFINFSKFYSIVNPGFRHPYYGRRNPPVAGTALNHKYHFGRISEAHKYHNKEFPLPKGIQWNSGGMYVLDHKSASVVSNYENTEWIDSHLYEDVMIYMILNENGIAPVHHENSEASSLAWMAPTIDGILTPDLASVSKEFTLDNFVSVHCGAAKSSNLDNREIWDVLYKIDRHNADSCAALVGGPEQCEADELLNCEKIIRARSLNRPLSFYLNKVVSFGGQMFLLRSEAGQIVRRSYAKDVWLDLVGGISGNVTVYIPDFNVSFLPSAGRATELPSDSGLQPGLTFLVRAKNEVNNIDFMLNSLRPVLNDESLNCELVFVDNASTDGTYAKVVEITKSSGIRNMSLYSYGVEISRSGDEHATLQRSGKMHRSLDTYYNWCLARAGRRNVIKWDADFLAILDNLRLMISEYDLAQTDGPLAIWCSGKTLFKHGEKFYINENTMYNEFRVFSKAQGYKWEYAPRWEICSREYMAKADKHVFSRCVFLELKDVGRNEFESRSQGAAIATDVRDKRDDEIIQALKSSSLDSMRSSLVKLDFDPLAPASFNSPLLNAYEATLEELDAMQSYWLNVYSRPESPRRFEHEGNAIVQGL
jgi:glycosyltransferase involved in cell wall biosynthesis